MPFETSRAKRLVVLVVLLSLSLGGVLAGPAHGRGNAPLAEKRPLEVFLDHCAKCHGSDGNAETWMGRKHKMPKFSSERVQKQSDKELAATIRKGKNRMPSWEDRLTAEEIAQVISVIREFGKSTKDGAP